MLPSRALREMARQVYLYVLPLQANRWYVGSSTNVAQRVAAHRAGSGAAFTQAFRPVGPPAVIRKAGGTTPVGLQEDQLCLEYMCVYGIDRVRGGSHCAVTLPEAQRAALERIVRHAHNVCLTCGMPNHYTNECRAHKRRRRAQTPSPPPSPVPAPVPAPMPAPVPAPVPASVPAPVLSEECSPEKLETDGNLRLLRFVSGYSGKRVGNSGRPELIAVPAELQPYQQRARKLMHKYCLCCFEPLHPSTHSWSRWCPRCYAQLKRAM